LAKNLTMSDEEFFRGTTAELLEHISRRVIQGELTLVIEGTRRRGSRRGNTESRG
jgi:16S rRNA C1402 (ribose-2'-O) methylase RsmI